MNELEKLRDKFFNECTDSIDGLPRVNMAPHDLLKWFEKQLTQPKSGKSAEEVLNEKIMFHNKDLPKGFELGPFSHRETNCFIEAMHEFAQQKEPKEEYRLTDSDIVKKLENVHNRIATLPIEEKGLDEYFKIVNSLNEIKSNIKWFIHNEKHKQKEEPKPLTEWISVKDRLPELNKMVIMFSDKIETLALTEMEGCICVTDFYFYPILLSDSKVTHWMPLPNKPI